MLITEKSEGSAYLITFHVDALRPVGGQLEELQSQRDPSRRGKAYEALLASRKAKANGDIASADPRQPAAPAAPDSAADPAAACGLRGQIASTADAPPTLTQTNFANSGQTNLVVYWIDDHGKEGDYQRQPQPLLRLAPGQMLGVQAYAGYFFSVVDQNGTCVAVTKATAGANNFSFAGAGGGGQVASADPDPVQKDAGGAPAGRLYTTALDYAQAGGNTCDLEGKIVSIDDPKPAGIDLHLQNGGQGYLFLYWIDQSGKQGNYDHAPLPLANLIPGQSASIQTTSGQAFMVRDQNGSCVGIVQASTAQTNFTF